MLRTSISPEGQFRVALHRPSCSVINLREQDRVSTLGHSAGELEELRQKSLSTAGDDTEHLATFWGWNFGYDFLMAIRNNRRTDRGDGEKSLVVWEYAQVLLFVPKAQISQWELQLVVKANSPQGPVGNVFEADTAVRQSIDRGILLTA